MTKQERKKTPNYHADCNTPQKIVREKAVFRTKKDLTNGNVWTNPSQGYIGWRPFAGKIFSYFWCAKEEVWRLIRPRQVVPTLSLYSAPSGPRAEDFSMNAELQEMRTA